MFEFEIVLRCRDTGHTHTMTVAIQSDCIMDAKFVAAENLPMTDTEEIISVQPC